MNSKAHITLLDPSLQNNNGDPSDNLGDLVIYDSIRDLFTKIFPGKEIQRISTHVPFTKKEKHIINNSLYTFVGGSNILTSDIRNFPRLTPVKQTGFYLYPGFKDLILLGTGWSSYQHQIDWATKFYYKKILRKDIFHSVRDIYSQNQLKKAGFNNILHTSCPSTWNLDTSFVNVYNPAYKKILFTLTSYYPDKEEDNLMVETIIQAQAEKNYFFPQTKTDTAYLKELPAYKKNTGKITLLHHDIADFSSLAASAEINYIGSRLHGGIKCLAYNNPTLILSVDNRASEMGKSINLNVVERNNMAQVKRWITNEFVPPQIALPFNNINHWVSQFKK